MIHQSTLNWLQKLGNTSPLFTELVLHFGNTQWELIFRVDGRHGIKVTNERSCRFCYVQADVPPPLPTDILDNMPSATLLNRIIDLNELRVREVAREHDIVLADIVLADIGNDIFKSNDGVDKEALGLSLNDITAIEHVISTGRSSFALALHSTNMGRLTETPLLIQVDGGTRYSLRRTTS